MEMNRRQFVFGAAAAFAPRNVAMSSKDRINRVLEGKTPDRAPYTFWHHFHDEKLPGSKHAALTLEYQQRYKLDLVKVMSDYPYPKPAGAWWEQKLQRRPFPAQLEALELIRDGLGGQKHFIETVFNPWNQAVKSSSKEEVLRLMQEKPQALLDALETIGKSVALHAMAAIEAGASGIFLAVDNAQKGYLTIEQYRKFSEPFDRMILEAVSDAPLNTVHVHGDDAYMPEFWQDWAAGVLSYSAHGTKVSIRTAHRKFKGIVMAGLDEKTVMTASPRDVDLMMVEARSAEPKWICAPGCSIPDDSSDADQQRLARRLGGLD